MPTVVVNYWAVLGCAVASMVLGYLWYGPVFGKMWMKSVGMNPNMSEAEKKEMMSKAGPGYAAMFIAALVTAYVLKHFLVYSGATTISLGLGGAFWAWFGFIATTALGIKFFEKKGWDYYVVNTGYHLVQLLMFSIILVHWM